MEITPTIFNSTGKIVWSRNAGTQILEQGKTNWYSYVVKVNAKPKVRNLGTQDAKALQECAPTLGRNCFIPTDY